MRKAGLKIMYLSIYLGLCMHLFRPMIKLSIKAFSKDLKSENSPARILPILCTFALNIISAQFYPFY